MPTREQIGNTDEANRVESLIGPSILAEVFSIEGGPPLDIVAEQLKPAEAAILRQALRYADQVRAVHGDRAADGVVDGVMRTITAFREQGLISLGD